MQHWGDGSDEAEDHQQTPPKLPKLHLTSQPHHHSPQYSISTLPLFAPQENSTTTTPTINLTRTGSYFSSAQWQELELQALIFRHMIAGADVPSELLHLVKKGLANSPYYVCNPIYQYYPHYQPPLVQSGYWSKAAMDPEPGRCRRTDGKKWRCSRDVVPGHRYCDRHVHRGKYRSRKPVESPSAPAAASSAAGGGGGDALKMNHPATQFGFSGTSSNLLHLDSRPLDSIVETDCPYEVQNDGGRTLRPFFDDWPRSLHETDSTASSAASATNLSISMNAPSDFSLKLGTGDGDEHGARIVGGQGEVGRAQMNWGMAWEGNRVGPMGGPLAEVLRSPTTDSMPTSVLLHRLTRGSEAGYVVSS
ncbi:growth-regulating factor 4 [Striga asiatica]|uniref:Growth-regulating factor n=1 Tax=Striga asiatica TaxID=4170 RepID=A0A5A7P8D1_STRAF|nr:growth-regulating factor 4 [Striga asiatica]